MNSSKLIACKRLSGYHFTKKGISLLLLSAAILLSQQSRAQSISLTTIGVPYLQNFNTLASTGTTNTLSINGWYLNETGTGANAFYTADNGSNATGDVYSYAPSALPGDRALGTLRTATFSAIFGAKFTNNTGYTITSLYVNYKGEEYRQGVTGGGDELDFSYSTNATDLVTGTYTNVPALKYVTTYNGGPGATADPNQTPWARAVAGNITGLSIAPGATVWIRWTDIVSGTAECGLAVDDFSLTPGAACSLVETFEGITPNATSYTSNGINFTLTTTPASPDFRCSNDLPTFGFNYSDKYLDNFNNLPKLCTMTAPAASPFRLKYLYVYVSADNVNYIPQNSGVNITFTGKRGGITKFTYAPGDAIFAAANASDPYTRGFSLVDFSVPGYDNIAIDQLVVTIAGSTIYFAIDNMSFCAGACNTITVTNPGVVSGTQGSAFSQTFTQSGGTLPVTFTTASTLPTGLSLSSAGLLSGTPTQAGTFPITVTVTDANGCPQAGSSYNLVIACPTITVANPGTTTGTVGTAFSQNFVASGGTAPYTYTTVSTLPTGLSLSTAGVLSGTPTQSGSFPIVVKATDASPSACFGNSPTYTLVISCQTITVTNPAVTTGINGAPFSQTFTQTGALAGATFTINTGTLPTGLTLSTAGVLSGTPTQTGSFPVTVKVTDGHGCTGIGATYNLSIGAPAPLMSASLRDALLVDANSNGIANPNDQIRYTTTIRNTGSSDATGVNYQDTVPVNTTLNAGTNPVTSALARDDNFTVGSNATYSSGNVVTNDFGIPSVSVVSFGTTASLGTTNPAGSAGTTDQGGTLTVNANGSFTYTSALNFTGTDKFMYIATTGVAGLPNNDAVVIITVNPDISFTTTPVNILCNGASTGSITFSGVSGGSGSGYTYSINGAGGPFQGSVSFTGLPAATYTPAVKDGSGYIKVGAPVTLTEPPTAVSFTHVDVNNTCNGASTGSITITASGGTPGYTYSKNGPGGPFVGGNAFTGLTGGTYSISVKDNNGCISTQSVTLTDPAAVTFTFSKTDPTCFGAANGTITFNPPSGGTGPYTYSITGTGGTFFVSGSFTGLAPNTYTLVVKDNFGCNSATQSTTVTDPLQITVSGTIANLVYNVTMANATFTKTNGVGSPATPWSATGLPTGVSINSATGVVSGTPLQTGSFNATITYTDANGCTGSKVVAFTVAPNLQNNSYNVVGNTQLAAGGQALPATPATSDATNILTNDGADVPITVTAGTFATTNAGSITIDAAGKFTYTPKLNSIAADSYTYTGTANGVSATAVINFTVANMVWYVKGGGAAGDGRSNTPLNSLPSGNLGGVGDFIYVEKETSGTTPGSITLQASQKLIGAGATLNVPSVSPLLTITGTAGNTPTLTNAVRFANSVTVDGIDMTTTTNTAITNNGTTVTGVTVNIRNITTTTGNAVLITGSGNSVNITIASLTANVANDPSAFSAVAFQNTSGTVTINGGSIHNSSGTAFGINGGSATYSYAGTINQGVANQLAVNILSTSGSTITFSGNITATGSSLGINCNTNPGSTISFTGTLNFNTSTSPAFTATGGGTISAIGSGSTITTTTATALNVANTTIGASGITFQSISAGTAASGPTSGIILNTTGASGGLTVSGGTIQKTTGSGISLTSVGGGASFANMTITNTAGDGITAATVTNLSMNACNISNSGGSASKEGLRLTELSGNATFTNINSTNSTEHNFFLQNASATLASLAVNGGNYSTSNNAFASAGNGMIVIAKTTGTITTASVTGVTFSNNFSTGVQAQAQDNATIGDFIVSNCTIQNNGAAAADFDAGTGSPQIKFHMLNNLNITGNVGPVINVFSSATGTGGLIQGRIDGNHIGTTGVVHSGSTGGAGVRVFLQGVPGNITIVNNIIRATACSRGIDVQAVGPAPANGGNRTSDIVITGNDVNNVSSDCAFPLNDIYLAADDQAGTTVTLRAEVHGNTIKTAGAVPANTDWPFDNLEWLYYDRVNSLAAGTPEPLSAAQLVDFGGPHANANAAISTTQTSGSAKANAAVTLIAGPINIVL